MCDSDFRAQQRMLEGRLKQLAVVKEKVPGNQVTGMGCDFAVEDCSMELWRGL